MAKHDNWRHELADAGTFNPGATADRLLDAASLQNRVCEGKVQWIIGKPEHVDGMPWAAGQAPVAQAGDLRLWKTGPEVCR